MWNVLVMGFAFMFIFTAFQTTSMIEVTVFILFPQNLASTISTIILNSCCISTEMKPCRLKCCSICQAIQICFVCHLLFGCHAFCTPPCFILHRIDFIPVKLVTAVSVLGWIWKELNVSDECEVLTENCLLEWPDSPEPAGFSILE